MHTPSRTFHTFHTFAPCKTLLPLEEPWNPDKLSHTAPVIKLGLTLPHTHTRPHRLCRWTRFQTPPPPHPKTHTHTYSLTHTPLHTLTHTLPLSSDSVSPPTHTHTHDKHTPSPPLTRTHTHTPPLPDRWMWKVLHSLYFIFLDPWLELLGLKAIKRFPNLSSFKRFPNLSSFSFLPDMNREASRMASPRSRTVINSSLPAYSPSQGVEATTGNSILDRVRSCQYMSVQYL